MGRMFRAISVGVLAANLNGLRGIFVPSEVLKFGNFFVPGALAFSQVDRWQALRIFAFWPSR